MKPEAIVNLLTYLEPAMCFLALLLIYRRGGLRDYKYVVAYLATRLVTFLILFPLLHFCGTVLDKHVAYHLYFYTYWSSYTIEALLGFGIIMSIYKLAMAPLRGLQRLGMIMFRWAGGISITIALTTAFTPHLTSMGFVMRAVTELQRTQGILTLCMLMFVCLAIRPMGLSFTSKIFGISLGLGLLAVADLIETAWLTMGVSTMSSTFDEINGCAVTATLAIWIGYFAMPEPRRRMIVLPTTSPFLRWNQISIALGDEPGYVAIGGVNPDFFAPAEVEIMRRASLKMTQATIS